MFECMSAEAPPVGSFRRTPLGGTQLTRAVIGLVQHLPCLAPRPLAIFDLAGCPGTISTPVPGLPSWWTRNA
jgi:hypothetical protein